MYKYLIVLLTIILSFPVKSQFRVFPYLQNPGSEAITIMWFSDDESDGTLSYHTINSKDSAIIESPGFPAPALGYSLWEDTMYFEGNAPNSQYKHRIRLTNLEPSTTYQYTVAQGSEKFTSSFRTAPATQSPFRFIVYSDSETEPESTGKNAEWNDNAGPRVYLIDQTTGYRNNLNVIKSRSPDLLFVAGDLVESGGEQRDWDEFWKHNTNADSSLSVAGRIPIMAVPGNHEYFDGPFLDQYNQPGSERAINKFLTYFENPQNGSDNIQQEGRFYCLKYGNVAFIALDGCNNGVNGTTDDSNFYLLGESDTNGGNAPDFGIGSYQYQWLEQKLQEFQKNSRFIFVLFHHSPYSSGPHGFAAGNCDTCESQSGRPLRLLTDLFLKYGVDAVFSGHDEIWERSEVKGYEILPGGDSTEHVIEFYDVGTGGDNLRKPVENLVNPYQKYIPGSDSRETWQNSILVSGGRHYGHLEVNIYPGENNAWNALMTPVYVFPVYNTEDSAYSGFERRVYNDEILLTKFLKDTAVYVSENNTDLVFTVYPNPFHSIARIEFYLTKRSSVHISVLDMRGRLLKIIEDNNGYPGLHEIEWDGTDGSGNRVSGGLYLLRMVTDEMTTIKKIIYSDSR